MSLLINVSDIEQVLLSDGCLLVRDFSFDIDTYEFTETRERRTLAAGGLDQGISRTGAAWTEPDGAVVVCPLSSILAVKWVGEQKVSRRKRGEPTAVPAYARPAPPEPPGVSGLALPGRPIIDTAVAL